MRPESLDPGALQSRFLMDIVLQVGTYNTAVLAARHNIPFIVVAPVSTVDLEVPDGGGYVHRVFLAEACVRMLSDFLGTTATGSQLSIGPQSRRALSGERYIRRR